MLPKAIKEIMESKNFIFKFLKGSTYLGQNGSNNWIGFNNWFIPLNIGIVDSTYQAIRKKVDF
jgi:hypothetical protein